MTEKTHAIRDTILLSEFLPKTQHGIRAICSQLGWEPESVNWSLMFFIMRELPDSELFFPSGKWATIQRLESMLIDLAKEYDRCRKR